MLCTHLRSTNFQNILWTPTNSDSAYGFVLFPNFWSIFDYMMNLVFQTDVNLHLFKILRFVMLFSERVKKKIRHLPFSNINIGSSSFMNVERISCSLKEIVSASYQWSEAGNEMKKYLFINTYVGSDSRSNLFSFPPPRNHFLTSESHKKQVSFSPTLWKAAIYTLQSGSITHECLKRIAEYYRPRFDDLYLSW